MILVWGDDSDPPVARILAELQHRGAAHVHIGPDLAGLQFDIRLEPAPRGTLWWNDHEVRVEAISGLYVRPGPTPAGQMPAAAALSALASFLPVSVANRPVAGRSNWSKPFQAGLLKAAGFRVPATLLTTDPAVATAFAAQHERVIYKSISGVRSIVSLLDVSDSERLHAVRNAPVQFQQWIDGTDVRVHIVGDRVFATTVESPEIDYRYPRSHSEVALEPVELPAVIADRLVRFVQAQGLLLAGADLRVTPAGDWYAFELNPSPGFSFYEDATGQPIAAAVVDLLCG